MVNSTYVQCSVQTGYNVTKERQSAIEIACHKKLCHLLHKTKSFDARATSEYQRVILTKGACLAPFIGACHGIYLFLLYQKQKNHTEYLIYEKDLNQLKK